MIEETPKATSPLSPKPDEFNIPSFFKRFSPLFALSALIPIFVFLLSPEGSITSIRADERELRVWYEPKLVNLKIGQEAKVNVIAEFVNQKTLLTNLDMQINSDPGLSINPNKLSYTKPFRGRVIVGEISIKADQLGTYQLNSNILNSTTANNDEIKKIVAPAEITVK
jgi:hypothetical protein